MNEDKKWWMIYIIDPLIASVVTVLISLLAYKINVPNPVIILVAVMIFFTIAVSTLSGFLSGIFIILYAMFFFSEDHSFFRYSDLNLYKLIVIIISLIVIFCLVAWIKGKRELDFHKLIKVNKQLEKTNATLEDESVHDPLTGLYNRRGGEERLASALENNKKNKVKAAAAIMDIDDFKDINDRYGHGAGDEALLAFSKSLKETFSNNSILIRTGGDEFVIVQEDDVLSFEKELIEFASRKFSFEHEGHVIYFTISCGYSFFPENITNAVETLRQADTALYQAKVEGKHIACKYEGGTTSSDIVQGFATRGIAENLPVAFMVYKADESEKILLASDSLLKICECKDQSSFMEMTGGTFRGFVYPEDREETEKSIRRQIYEKKAELDSVHYRIKTKTGKIIELHDLGHLVHDENLGDLFYIALYNKDILKAE